MQATTLEPAMTKQIFALFLKSHVDTFTRKDGVVVQAHETKVQKKGKAEEAKPKKDWRDEENWHTRTMMKFETLPDESLKYIIKDATEAADLLEQDGGSSKKSGQYRDECHYAHKELHKRRHSGSPMVRAAQAMQDHHATMRAEKAEIDRAAKG